MCDLCFTLGHGTIFDVSYGNEQLYISYSAYSTDSSFEDTIYGFRFCPFCGTNLEKESQRIKLEKEKQFKKELAKKQAKERKIAKRNEELRLERIANAKKESERLIQIGSYNVYYYDGVEYKTSSREELKYLLLHYGIEYVKSKAKCIASFTKGVEQPLQQKKKVKVSTPTKIINSKIELNNEQTTIKSISPKERYTLNKNASVGDEVICPSCKKTFLKRSYQQAFCCNKGKNNCKDNFWNNLVN